MLTVFISFSQIRIVCSNKPREQNNLKIFMVHFLLISTHWHTKDWLLTSCGKWVCLYWYVGTLPSLIVATVTATRSENNMLFLVFLILFILPYLFHPFPTPYLLGGKNGVK